MGRANDYKSWPLVALLALPWLIPPISTPTPALMPWLVTLGCAAVLALMNPALLAISSKGQGSHALARLLAKSWLMAALLSTLIAACQYFDVEHLFPGMSAAEGAHVYGNLLQRNQYASLTMLGLAVLLGWASEKNFQNNTRQTILIAVMAAFLAAGNAASGSRTGLLELVLVSAMFVGWGSRRSHSVWIVVVVVGMTYGMVAWVIAQQSSITGAPGGILARFGEQIASCATRTVMWQNVVELILQHPWTGWGWGELDYAHFVTEYSGLRQCELIDNAHNLFLHVAVEAGLPVAAVLACLTVYIAWRGQPWQERLTIRQVMWAGLGVVFIHSMLEYPLWYGPFSLSLCLALQSLRRSPLVQAANARTGYGWTRTGAAITLVAVTYATWDYDRVRQIYLEPEQRSLAYRDHTLHKISDSWLFSNQVRFAEFTLTPLRQEVAEQIYRQGRALLHFSPEPRVVEKLLDSTLLLGYVEEAQWLRQRFRVAYPADYERWIAGRTLEDEQLTIDKTP